MTAEEAAHQIRQKPVVDQIEVSPDKMAVRSGTPKGLR